MGDEERSGDTKAPLTNRESSREIALVRRPVPTLRKKGMIAWYQLLSIVRSKGFLGRVVVTLLNASIVVGPWLALRGRKGGLVGIGLFVVVQLIRKWRESSPANMKLVERDYLRRKLGMYKAIIDAQNWPQLAKAQHSVENYQREVLQLIASYVRGHRGDQKGTTVFANLLVEDGDELVVIARDREHRQTPARYPKRGMIAWEALTTGDYQFTGDVYADYPDTQAGKKYHSILVIPVRSHGKVLGVVSIDSSKHYHFDLDYTDLVEYLQPYIALLVWSLEMLQNGTHSGI